MNELYQPAQPLAHGAEFPHDPAIDLSSAMMPMARSCRFFVIAGPVCTRALSISRGRRPARPWWQGNGDASWSECAV